MKIIFLFVSPSIINLPDNLSLFCLNLPDTFLAPKVVVGVAWVARKGVGGNTQCAASGAELITQLTGMSIASG